LQSNFNYLNLLKDIDAAKRIQLEQELAAAHQEIAFQNEEKVKRAKNWKMRTEILNNLLMLPHTIFRNLCA
jgi:hypothetical protein